MNGTNAITYVIYVYKYTNHASDCVVFLWFSLKIALIPSSELELKFAMSLLHVPARYSFIYLLVLCEANRCFAAFTFLLIAIIWERPYNERWWCNADYTMRADQRSDGLCKQTKYLLMWPPVSVKKSTVTVCSGSVATNTVFWLLQSVDKASATT